MIEPSSDVQMGKSTLQLFRYGAVGLVSNSVIYLLYLLVTFLGAEPKKAMTLLYIVGASIGFIGNRRWTFAHYGPFTQTVMRYMVSHVLGYLLNYVVIFIFVDFLKYAHQGVQAVAIVVVAVFLFIIFKYYVFPKNRKS